MVIGVVGKTCSGKNEVSSYFEEKGFYLIDVDHLGHLSLEENKDSLIASFSKDIMTDGLIDRKKLGSIVFSDPDKLSLLNSITHPWMVEETKRLIEAHDNAVINAALLESMGLDMLCDEIIFVFSSKDIRKERALKRDGISEDQFEKRNSNQVNIGITLFTNCKKVITILNDSSYENLKGQLDSYYSELKKRCLV